MKKALIILAIIAVTGLIAAFYVYRMIFNDNVKGAETVELYIPTGASYEDVTNLLKEQDILEDPSSFNRVAGWMKYHKDEVPSGYYRISGSASNKDLIGKLRSGNQTPVKLVINNDRTLPDLAGTISKFIESDSMAMLDFLMDDQVQSRLGYNNETFMTMFIPNTYEVFWNTSPQTLAERLKKEHDKFWENNSRKDKASAMNMTPEEVYTLASIVEKESAHKPERPTIASLYLNRLKRGMLLQADPTVVYANQDFTLRRVLNRHLEIDSPYNTYKYAGLPPGPIGMASINSIDAVLNPASTAYLYMCAKPGYGTEHAFARSLAEHNRNANIYRRWLSQQGILN